MKVKVVTNEKTVNLALEIAEEVISNGTFINGKKVLCKHCYATDTIENFAKIKHEEYCIVNKAKDLKAMFTS